MEKTIAEVMGMELITALIKVAKIVPTVAVAVEVVKLGVTVMWYF